MTSDASVHLALLHTAPLHPAAVLQTARLSPIPAAAGLYAWYFDTIPPGVPAADCHQRDGLTLLYVGIAPSRVSSRSHLRKRLRNHLKGNASQSTLRRTLGCLLTDSLGIKLAERKNGRLTFGDGEATLSQWLANHAHVAWVEHPAPWDVEPALIQSLSLPLNLDHNRAHPFHPTLTALRRAARRQARA